MSQALQFINWAEKVKVGPDCPVCIYLKAGVPHLKVGDFISPNPATIEQMKSVLNTLGYPYEEINTLAKRVSNCCH